jgi:hypothetical protein
MSGYYNNAMAVVLNIVSTVTIEKVRMKKKAWIVDIQDERAESYDITV